ncbi:hypothetical protein C8R43DRAFT_1186704 [Mycena crocata]|nr:hypothetical protein C8R43DRAFT_1186704 [Mycena crocata]
MHFSSLSIAVAVTLGARVNIAAPAADDTYPLLISHIVPAGAYTLTYWSDALGISRAARAPVPCTGNNDVTCSGSHKADSQLCSQLVNTLSSNSGHVVGNSPRAICLGQGGNQCCVSWSAAVGNMPQGDLFNAANKVFHNCFGSSISGLARNVALNGGCVTECLSNRPDGCS